VATEPSRRFRSQFAPQWLRNHQDGSAILRRRNHQYVHVKTPTYGATCRRFRRRTL